MSIIKAGGTAVGVPIIGNTAGGNAIALSGASIAEAAANNAAVGTASASGTTGTAFWLITDASGTFQIDSTTGAITVLSNTALASNASFSVTVSVTGLAPAPPALVTTIWVVATEAALALDPASDSSGGSKVTNVTTPVIDFTATLYVADLVQFYLSTIAYGSPHSVTSGEVASGQITLGMPPLSDGAKSLTATISRGGYINTASGALTFTIQSSAAILSSATGTKSGSTTADIAVTTNQVTNGGTMWWVVVLSSDTAPTAAEVKAGQKSGGGSPPATNGPGGTSVSASPFTASVTGLTPLLTYKAYFVQTDVAANTTTVASSNTFTEDAAALSMSYTPVTSATYNVAYTGATPSTSGGVSPYTYSIHAGILPTGMTLDTSTGIISGTDSTDSGGHDYTGIVLRVTDNIGTTADSSSFDINVLSGLTMSYAPVTHAKTSSAYTGATPSTSSGTAPYTYSIHAGTLPTGMSLDTSTGVISGTCNILVVQSGIVLRVTDNVSATFDSAAFQIAVYAGVSDTIGISSVAYWGARAGNWAYAVAGSACMDVCNSTDGTGTTTINFLDTGYVDDATIQALSYYPNVAVKKLYDHSGNGNHLVQATLANMPIYSSTSGPNSYPGIDFTGSSSQYLSIASFTQNASFSAIAVGKRNGTATGGVIYFSNSVPNSGALHFRTANLIGFSFYSGTIATVAATDGSFHALQAITSSGGNGYVYSDGTGGTPQSSTSYNQNASLVFGAYSGANYLTGTLTEGGVYSSNFVGASHTAAANTGMHNGYGGW